MRGYRETIRSVASLVPGDRVVWHDTYRVVQSVETIDDGSGHLSVTFQDAPASRYSAIANVTVLELAHLGEGGAS